MTERFVFNGSVIRLMLPALSSGRWGTAAAIFERELLKRAEVQILRTSYNEGGGVPALDVYLGTPDTLPPELPDRLETPLTFLPFPDYAEHVNLRTIMDSDPPAILIACGSESAFLAGIGSLLRQLAFRAEGFAFDDFNVNLKPITPVRGTFYANLTDSNSYFTYSDSQWDALITESALWGNNTVGFVPVHFPEWPGVLPWQETSRFQSSEWRSIWEAHWERQCGISETIHRLGLKSLIWLSCATVFPDRIGITPVGYEAGEIDPNRESGRKMVLEEWESLLSRLPHCDSVWLSAPYDLLSPFARSHTTPGTLLEMARVLRDMISTDCDVWHGSGGFGEEDLSQLFDRLNAADFGIRGAICGPEIGPHETARREMPLSLQLMTMTPLSRVVRTRNAMASLGMPRAYVFSDDTPLVQPSYLARQFFESAPLTYGALGFSTGAHDEVHRFLWSLYAWSPQPSIEAMLESYGRMYFGAASAPMVRDALLTLERCWNVPLAAGAFIAERVLILLDEAERAVPACMEALAAPRLRQIRLRALMDITLAGKVRAGQDQIGGMVERLRRYPAGEPSAESALQSAIDLLKESPYRGLEKPFEQLSELRQAIFDMDGLHVQSVDRLLEPEADRNWALVQIDRAIRSGNETEQRKTIDSIRSKLEPAADSKRIEIDCGNPETDSYRTQGMVYHLNVSRRDWRQIWYQIALSHEEGTPVEYTIPLNGKTIESISVTYVTTKDLPLKQSLFCGETVLHDVMEIPANEPMEITFTIPPIDGELRLRRSGKKYDRTFCNVIYCGAGILPALYIDAGWKPAPQSKTFCRSVRLRCCPEKGYRAGIAVITLVWAKDER